MGNPAAVHCTARRFTIGRTCASGRYRIMAVKGSRLSCCCDGRTAMVHAGPFGRVVSRKLSLAHLLADSSHPPVPGCVQLGPRWPTPGSIRASVETDVPLPKVLIDSMIVDMRDISCRDSVYRAVVVERSMVPIAAVITVACIPITVVDIAVVSD